MPDPMVAFAPLGLDMAVAQTETVLGWLSSLISYADRRGHDAGPLRLWACEAERFVARHRRPVRWRRPTDRRPRRRRSMERRPGQGRIYLH